MSEACCQNKSVELAYLVVKQRKVLWIVLIINLVMFVAEFCIGLMAGSQALIADSLDMLGDVLAYWSTLYVLNMSMQAKIRSSQFKAWLMMLFAFVVLVRVCFKILYPENPDAQIMGAMGGLALLANSYCLFLLSKHKEDDINFRSVWICSRNDLMANTAVILGAVLVYFFKSHWPDIVIGLGITLLFIHSSWGIFKDSYGLKKTLN